MELDQLKTLWQKENNKYSQNDEKLLNMIQQSPSGPVAKMQRRLQFELVSAILVYGLCAIVFLFWKGGIFYEITLSYIALGMLFSIYYFFKMRILNQMQCLSCEVRSNLEKHIRLLEKYIRLYLWSVTLIIPVLLIYFGWLGFHKKALYGLPSRFGSFSEIALPYLTLTLVFSVAIFFGNRAYLRKSYSRYIYQLRSILQEMNEP